MKLGFISAAALLTVLPGAALADSATYSAVYSPALDLTTRSCEITNTGVQGSNGARGGLNGRLQSDNTAIMRTIGQGAGTAQATAGIQLSMVGANIVTIENATMEAIEQGETVSNNGSIKLDIPSAKVDISNSKLSAVSRELGFNYESGRGSQIAAVNFKGGTAEKEKVGSIIVGKKTGKNEFKGSNTNSVISNLAASRINGSRTGTVRFQLNNIDADTPATLMQATISCEPVPVQRESSAFITPIN